MPIGTFRMWHEPYISEKTTSVKKSIADLMSEVVRSCGKYFCPEKCGKFFGTKNPIKKHLLSHRPQNEWPIVCLFCGKHFQCLNDLPKHLKTQQHINDSSIPKIGTPAWDEMLAKSVKEVWIQFSWKTINFTLCRIGMKVFHVDSIILGTRNMWRNFSN